MSKVEFAVERILTARAYVNGMFSGISGADWFRQPEQGVSHLAWQMGHLAMAQYRLALERIRGVMAEDNALIPPEFLTHFGKGSTPDPSPANNPTPSEIRTVFERVYERVLAESENWTDQSLDEPTIRPHEMFGTKFGALQWAAAHEMLHAGQIGLLRRLLGKPPLR